MFCSLFPDAVFLLLLSMRGKLPSLEIKTYDLSLIEGLEEERSRRMRGRMEGEIMEENKKKEM